ncbi:MAG TPA: hypothetical protein VGI79_00395 [Caulobacteraceae bacterium]
MTEEGQALSDRIDALSATFMVLIRALERKCGLDRKEWLKELEDLQATLANAGASSAAQDQLLAIIKTFRMRKLRTDKRQPPPLRSIDGGKKDDPKVTD